VMPQGYTPPKDQSYRSPPFINPSSVPRPSSNVAAAPSASATVNVPPLHRPGDRHRYGSYAVGVRPLPHGNGRPYDAGVRPLQTAPSVSAAPSQIAKAN
jgi:hypothetical protein